MKTSRHIQYGLQMYKKLLMGKEIYTLSCLVEIALDEVVRQVSKCEQIKM